MYQIISMTGKILTETDSPVYTKFNFDNGAWIPANEFDAQCVVVNGERCVIFGQPFSAGADKVVFVKKIDAAEKISKLAQDFSNDNLDIVEAIIELDRKISAISQSLEAFKNG